MLLFYSGHGLPPLPAHAGWAVAGVTLAALLAWRTHRMDGPGAAVGWLLALAIFAGTGAAGLLWLLLFFLMGTAASRHQLQHKQRLGLAQGPRARRSVANALGNGGVAALAALLAWGWPAVAPYGPVLVAGSLAAATADTLGSELGNVWGSRFVNVLTFRADQRGRDGVVSLEGTLAGAAGAAALAAVCGFTHGWPSAVAVWLAGVAGNAADSLLGATLQRRGVVSNHGVNLLATAVGAVLAAVLVQALA